MGAYSLVGTKAFSRNEDYIVSNFREKMSLSVFFVVNMVARENSLLEILEVYRKIFVLGLCPFPVMKILC